MDRTDERETNINQKEAPADLYAEADRLMEEIKTCCLEENFSRGLVLFWDNRKLLKEYMDIDYILLCRSMAAVYENFDKDEAAGLADEAWRCLPEYEEFLTVQTIWGITYLHHIFHFLYRKESGYEEELLKLYGEIAESEEAQDEETRAIQMKILLFILEEHMGHPEMSRYLSVAEELYRIAPEYEKEIIEAERNVLNRRTGAYYLAQVYLSQGNMMAAEQYLKETVALAEEFPNDTVDFYGLHKLAMVYYVQSNFEAAAEIAEKLADFMEQAEEQGRIGQNELQTGTVLLSNIFAAVGEYELSADIVREPLEEGMIYPEPGKKFITYIYDLAVYRTIAYHRGLPEKYREEFVQYMKNMECSAAFVKLSDMEMAEHYAVKALLYWKLGDLSVLKRFESRFGDFTRNIRAWEIDAFYFPCLIVMAVNMELGRQAAAVAFTRRAVEWSEKYFGNALVYQNRKRLSDFCASRNKIFYAAYSVYRRAGKIKECYSLLLNYKNMESLITVFRNRVTDGLSDVKELAEEINELLDVQAGILMNERMGNEDFRRAQIEKQLEEKEYLFARSMNREYAYRPFTAQEVLEKITEDSACIEYLFYMKDFYRSMLEADYHEHAQYQLDVYLFVKKGGQIKKKCFSITKLERLLRELTYYLSEMGKRHHKKIERSREILYEYLIAHIENELTDIKTIYIAPDGNLCNLPFYALTDKNGVMLGEKYQVLMIDTGRDFLRKSSEVFASHFTVVGNPAYDYVQLRSTGERARSGVKGFWATPIHSLPFSELEARLVAGRLGTAPFLGREASRHVSERMPSSRWIHLATHGVYDAEAFDGGWYSSALLFAGSENWRRTGIEDGIYGNGVLTADEISRMKLEETEMVVLSACYGGRVNAREMAGICQGFRAAGVKYIVSALWEVDDIAALIFMDEFYEKLKSRTIPEAMEAARRKLRCITVLEAESFLRECSSAYALENREGISEGMQYMDKLKKQYTEDYKIYSDPYFWSGFVCYQNTF